MPSSPRLLALFFLGRLVSGINIIDECNSKLPMSLATVISDLEAEGVTKLGTSCFLTSHGVTQGQKAAFFGVEDVSTTSFATDSGICMALSPSSIPEVASTAVACGGNIIYYPNEDDLSRGEGLFDSLGPAMERILNEGMTSSSSLIVVSSNPATTKAQLEAAAVDVLGNLVSPSKKAVLLEDVFSKVQYVRSIDQALALLSITEEPSQVQATIAATVASDFWQTTPISISDSMAAKDLAAARQLGPAARKALETAVETVKTMTAGSIVPNFGDLCEAATKRAMEELDESASAALASTIGKQIRANLKEEIAAELAELAELQLDFLKLVCFDGFKQDLSKLRISPNLATDMQNVASKAVASLAEKSKKMPISNADAKASFKTQLQEFCSERLLAARASGQFKPVPRKGVTIGLHWLLPKPFGNDYRQEPWMVHATDNLVYVPSDKITDVSPEEVATGDWRSKIVPCPAGNEMLYMQ